MNKTKRKVIVLFLSLFALTILLLGIYGFALTKVNNSDEIVNFTVEGGTSKIQIVNHLKQSGLIRSSLAVKIHLFFHNDIKL